MEITTVDIICLILIALIGFPHGAIDGPLLAYNPRTQNKYKTAIFLYILVGFLFWCFWHYYPNQALCIFLIISLIHFGLGDERNYFSKQTKNKFQRFIRVVSHGGLVTIVIPIFHPEKTSYIFQLLGSSFDFFINFFQFAFLLWCLCIIALCLITFKQKLARLPIYEIVILAVLCSQLDPLIFFTVYFCVLHTWRHVQSVRRIHYSDKQFLKTIHHTIPFIAITFLIVLGLASYGVFFGNFGLGDSLTKVVFILLASLTVPHMIFIDKFLNN